MIDKALIKKIVIPSVLILFGLLIIIFVIRPSIIGYGVYQQIKTTNYSIEDYEENIKELELKLLISDMNLSSCIFLNNEFSAELEKYSDRFFECELDKLDFSSSLSKCDETIRSNKEDLDEKNREINDLKIQFDLLVETWANNLCCKAKIDNPNIDFYIFENNKIICLEQGELKISCQ